MTAIAPTRLTNTAYWIATCVVVIECLGGGVAGMMQVSPFLDTATHLGYPAYFMSILGAWYAAAGDGAETLIGPAIFLGLTAASWALRPSQRRDFDLPARAFGRDRSILFWVATASVAAELAVGGVWDLLRIDYVRDVVDHLGYPTYLLTIMGVWKIPGAVGLLIPRFPRLKEWVYAGAVINYASAAASHLIVGDGITATFGPIALLALTVASWALLEPRRLGA